MFAESKWKRKIGIVWQRSSKRRSGLQRDGERTGRKQVTIAIDYQGFSERNKILKDGDCEHAGKELVKKEA